MSILISTFFIASALYSGQISSGKCPFEKWTSYRSMVLLRVRARDAYLFQTSHVEIDADGAPNAYHPDDVHLDCVKGSGFKGLDCPGNAGYHGRDADRSGMAGWRDILLQDPIDSTRPYIQSRLSKFSGYYVSQTSLQDKSKVMTNTKRYVDARNVPYLVLPGEFNKMIGTGRVGDLGFALNIETHKSSPFIVADVGRASADLGEISMALAAALGGVNPNPRTGAGAPPGGTLFVVFPASRHVPPWPVSTMQIRNNVNHLLGALGGKAAIEKCKFSLSM